MSDVGGVSGSRQRSFSDEEVDAMRKDESTSAIVNKARRDAGYAVRRDGRGETAGVATTPVPET